VGQYVFCARAWWLANGIGAEVENPAVQERGKRFHRQHRQKLWGVWWLQGLGWFILALAAGAAILAILRF
jgi:hypothetical protein